MNDIVQNVCYFTGRVLWHTAKMVVVGGAAVLKGAADAAINADASISEVIPSSSTDTSLFVDATTAVVNSIVEAASKQKSVSLFGTAVILIPVGLVVVSVVVAFVNCKQDYDDIYYRVHNLPTHAAPVVNHHRRRRNDGALPERLVPAAQPKESPQPPPLAILNLNAIPTTEADNPVEVCCVCLTNKKTIRYDSCCHLAICSACALIVEDKKCPVCREVSTSFSRVIS